MQNRKVNNNNIYSGSTTEAIYIQLEREDFINHLGKANKISNLMLDAIHL